MKKSEGKKTEKNEVTAKKAVKTEKNPVKTDVKKVEKKEVKVEKKVEAKKEVKEVKKMEKKAEVKVEKKEEKKEVKKVEKKEEKTFKVSAPEEVKKLRAAIKKKKHMKFRGRFGKSDIRRKANKKWKKWRYPRGADIVFERGNNPMPNIGRGTNGKIVGLHPSGYQEKLIHNLSGLDGLNDRIACRIAGTVGKKKKAEILKKAQEMKVKILNV